MDKRKKKLDYPLNRPFRDLRPLSKQNKSWQISETWRWRWARNPDLSHHLDTLEKLQKIKKQDIVVLTRQHNCLRFVRSFLRHYRELGADWIVVIDDGSTDGSRELLEAQADVILLTARTSYTDAQRGRDWFDAVLLKLPKRQKMITVDFDEYLVFSTGQFKLPALFDAMARRKLKKLFCLMVDCYPKPPVSGAVFDGQTDQFPWEVASCFDASGYYIHHKSKGLCISGGVRSRLFGIDYNLSKYAVFFNPGKPIFTHSIHAPQPFIWNILPVGGTLLHFKYFSDFIEDHKYIVARGVHDQGAETYKAILNQLNGVDVATEFSFSGPSTTVYEGANQLCKLGLMTDMIAA